MNTEETKRLGRRDGLRFALGILLDLADDATKVKAYHELHGEPSDTTVSEKLEKYSGCFSPETTFGEAYVVGLSKGIEDFQNVLREGILGHD